jgi:glycosyltransferase involved in cell wall biosynthesis
VETFGNSLLEIASAGKPVIASRVGGIPEIVQQGVNGLLVKQGDSEALANAMIRLLGDPVLAGQLGKRGKELACKYYSKESMVGRLEDLFLSPDMESA